MKSIAFEGANNLMQIATTLATVYICSFKKLKSNFFVFKKIIENMN